MLNFLYQLDISLVEIRFIYTLKLGIGGRLYMCAHSPRMQFVIRLSNSPKIEVKWVVLVKGLWYETPGSLGLPFDRNQSLSFPGLFHLGRAYTRLSRLCFDMPLFSEIFVCFDMPFFSKNFIGNHRRGRLVSWVEKASLDCIKWLLENTEREAQS